MFLELVLGSNSFREVRKDMDQPTVYIPEKSVISRMSTCPRCRIVWTHFEYHDGKTIKEAEDWVMQRYGQGPYQCPECGTWSQALESLGFWQRMRGEYRKIVSPPELVNRTEEKTEEEC